MSEAIYGGLSIPDAVDAARAGVERTLWNVLHSTRDKEGFDKEYPNDIRATCSELLFARMLGVPHVPDSKCVSYAGDVAGFYEIRSTECHPSFNPSLGFYKKDMNDKMLNRPYVLMYMKPKLYLDGAACGWAYGHEIVAFDDFHAKREGMQPCFWMKMHLLHPMNEIPCAPNSTTTWTYKVQATKRTNTVFFDPNAQKTVDA